MSKDGELSLVVQCSGCHCVCTNENSNSGNQKVTSEYVHIAIGLLSRFTKIISKFLDRNEERGNTQKEIWQVIQVRT